MRYTIKDIAGIVYAKTVIIHDTVVEHLLIDSRKVYAPATSLFFAIKGPRRNGHQFIGELYKKGVRSFIISEPVPSGSYPEANLLQVKDTMVALQVLTAYHRNQFSIPVIGITGSNGKTIVKEWLYQLLHNEYSIVRSPRSYNSQIGVPLSVWQMNKQHQLAVFEAGISFPGEMEKLEKIIHPTIGVFTNIGEAHSENFSSPEEKLLEKMKLFAHADIVIAGTDDVRINDAIKKAKGKYFRWGKAKDCDLRVTTVEKQREGAIIILEHASLQLELSIPFTDDASIENAITCCAVLLVLKTDPQKIRERMEDLHTVNMRLELKKGINHCSVINDSYSADLSSLDIALDFLDQQRNQFNKTVILSDFLQSSLPDEEIYERILSGLEKHRVTRLIGIGPRISDAFKQSKNDKLQVELYVSTDEFINQFRSSQYKEEAILVKGARIFAFERIVQLLEQKVHQTVLEINLNAIVHNLKEYQKLLKPSTKVMAMVKAFAYGSGGAEIAGVLQYHQADYLGVAYADEGVELRKAGITIPIMVMNPEESSFDALIENNLEPEIYSFEGLEAFDNFIKNEALQLYPVHIEIETGMNRLGFDRKDIVKLGEFLKATSSFKVQSVFTHLAASEEAAQDAFTNEQFERFESSTQQLQKQLGYSFIRHISNSAAVVRHPKLQLDMIRLGIGLYGVDSSGANKSDLQTVATLKSTVAQIKHLKTGESVSYNRKGKVSRDSVIATVRIGYADGYPRRLGNGSGKMYIKGKLAPVIGTVCMDMTMIDITDIPGVKEGDEVMIFGKELTVVQLAEWAGTIGYEIMTGISQRVKRIYFEE